MEREEERVKGEQKDGRMRCNSTYRRDDFDKLERLAMACNITPTTLQRVLVQICLDNESIINHVQDKYKRRSKFRIIPSRVDGVLHFIFAEKKKSR